MLCLLCAYTLCLIKIIRESEWRARWMRVDVIVNLKSYRLYNIVTSDYYTNSANHLGDHWFHSYSQRCCFLIWYYVFYIDPVYSASIWSMVHNKRFSLQPDVSYRLKNSNLVLFSHIFSLRFSSQPWNFLRAKKFKPCSLFFSFFNFFYIILIKAHHLIK